MSSLNLLEKAALENRLKFEKTLRAIKARITFPAIAHETLGLLNLRRKGPPLVAAGAVAGAVWLVNKFLVRNKTRTRRVSKTPTLKSGDQS